MYEYSTSNMLRTCAGERTGASFADCVTFGQCDGSISRFFLSRQFVDCCHFKHTFVAEMAQSVQLRAGRCTVRILTGPRHVTLLQSVQTVFGAHPGPYSMGTGVLSRG